VTTKVKLLFMPFDFGFLNRNDALIGERLKIPWQGCLAD
jgi:hypothetical protein